MLLNTVEIEEVSLVLDYSDQLIELLTKVVEDGASVGFLPPMDARVAEEYWKNVLAPEVILYIATMNKKVVGSIQLHLCTKQNGNHRAEIAKLMTHPDYRRNGIGRKLMEKAEARAREEGRTLLVLDTREGDPSNHLYASLAYLEAGRIPNYAKSGDGKLHATVFYYKPL